MSPAEMTCRQMVELVTGHLEGGLSPPDGERFEAHLGLCEGCQAYVEQMRLLVTELGRTPEVAPPPALERDLLEAFRDWRAGRS